LAENKNQVGNGERLFDTRVYVSYIECISFKFSLSTRAFFFLRLVSLVNYRTLYVIVKKMWKNGSAGSLLITTKLKTGIILQWEKKCVSWWD